MNNTVSFIKYLFLGMIAVILLGLSPIYAGDDSVPSLTVKGILLHKDGKPATNINVYFFLYITPMAVSSFLQKQVSKMGVWQIHTV